MEKGSTYSVCLRNRLDTSDRTVGPSSYSLNGSNSTQTTDGHRAFCDSDREIGNGGGGGQHVSWWMFEFGPGSYLKLYFWGQYICKRSYLQQYSLQRILRLARVKKAIARIPCVAVLGNITVMAIQVAYEPG